MKIIFYSKQNFRFQIKKYTTTTNSNNNNNKE